ncbi:MAG: HIT domain-containing protein [Nitrospirae bacterium]|nr:HIT domain-containing protein [Nitrospirota bacterium]
MKTLWAPWRMAYILSEKDQGCIFCEYPKQDSTKDRENLILFRSSNTFVVMNRYPYNNGHLMIAPYLHTPSLDELTDEALLDFMKVTKYAINVLKKVMMPEGFNIGINIGRIAGAGMESHIHLHMVPRWAGDTSFMTILEEVRVIPEHIMDTYDKLFSVFNSK